jgi:hypothetical protein
MENETTLPAISSTARPERPIHKASPVSLPLLTGACTANTLANISRDGVRERPQKGTELRCPM